MGAPEGLLVLSSTPCSRDMGQTLTEKQQPLPEARPELQAHRAPDPRLCFMSTQGRMGPSTLQEGQLRLKGERADPALACVTMGPKLMNAGGWGPRRTSSLPHNRP